MSSMVTRSIALLSCAPFTCGLFVDDDSYAQDQFAAGDDGYYAQDQVAGDDDSYAQDQFAGEAPPVSIPAPTKAGVTTSNCIYIRHGFSIWNKMHRKGSWIFQAPYDARLTNKGLSQAQTAGDNVKVHLEWRAEQGWPSFNYEKTALLVSNLDRAETTGVIAALGVDGDASHWKPYIMSSLQETSPTNDAASNLEASAVRTINKGYAKALADLNVEEAKLKAVFANAVAAWNKGNHYPVAREWAGYVAHFPKYVSYLNHVEGKELFIVAGHQTWWRRFAKSYGGTVASDCRTLGSGKGGGKGYLDNGEAISFQLKTTATKDWMGYLKITNIEITDCTIVGRKDQS